MTELERVWAHIKRTAQKCANAGQTLSQNQAERTVQDIVAQERAERPPREALAYLATELCAFIARYRTRRESTRSGDPTRN